MWRTGIPWLAALAKPAAFSCGPAVYYIAAPVAFLLCTVAVAAGVGGGALYMPVYYITTKDAHVAVPLAKVTTNGVGWSGLVFNIRRSNPRRQGSPLIDHDVALLLEPLTLLGTIAGVALNVFLTSTEVLVMLVVLLSYTAHKTLRKGLDQKRKEDAELSRRSVTAGEVEMASPNAQASSDGATSDGTPGSSLSRRGSIPATVPWEKVGILTALWLMHAAVLLASGGPLKMACGGLYEGALVVTDAVLLGGFTLFWGLRAAREEADAPEASREGRPSFAVGSVALYSVLSGLSGVAAGALGIAGGLLQGPMMISWGLLPQSATATAIVMTVFTSGSTILQFAILGRLQLLPSIVFWLVGFSGGLIGSKVVAGLLRRYGRQSYVSLFLGALVLASMLSMAGVDVMQMLGWLPEEESRNLREVCGERPAMWMLE